MVIFGDFLTIFAYKIFNIDVENTKSVTKMQTMDIIAKKSWSWNFFEIFGQNWANFDKKFGLFKITFCVITWGRMKLGTWNLVVVCRKKLQKTYRKKNFEFFWISLTFFFSMRNLRLSTHHCWLIPFIIDKSPSRSLNKMW